MALGWFLYPTAVRAFTTVSTDDAYVNSHITFVAPRVGGQVAEVFVDDNYRVAKGDLLVRLDPEPYRVKVAIKQAALDSARADATAALSQVKATEALARSQRWKLETAVQQVDNQVALLRARVAALRADQATLRRARADFKRSEKLASGSAISQEELDQRRQVVSVADAQLRQALEEVAQVRVGLGLKPTPTRWDQVADWADDAPGWAELMQTPPNLNQTFSSVRQALAELVQTVAQFSSDFDLPLSEDTPIAVIEKFRERDMQGRNVDRVLRDLLPKAPAVIQANAKVLQAEKDLAQAQLDLSYCEVRAEIDGVIGRRNINPGNYVTTGQQIMTIRSLTDIWIDCNFKETQLADVRIGQRVDLHVDMYGSRRVYAGRVSGFSTGTGSTLSLLPPQNATGNFVKVVQRLPVRVDLTEPPPPEAPLFAGTSVVPYVFVREAPTGPQAGQYLRARNEPITPAPATEKKP
ncbi:Membrane fusion component of tripartite multidrug resistance system [Fimbriiglobus ruber]|uniref:Membrane fusion component of tripartite multidrug resistance system n=1 Tax=Fimbriiglobus ruber TaxID=1908690 RepID=A0A225CZ42_9BACT|nr:Membrane fusion component of tripartite multidrug resistance system [Fimbriiglobus ruber]